MDWLFGILHVHKEKDSSWISEHSKLGSHLNLGVEVALNIESWERKMEGGGGQAQSDWQIESLTWWNNRTIIGLRKS